MCLPVLLPLPVRCRNGRKVNKMQTQIGTGFIIYARITSPTLISLALENCVAKLVWDDCRRHRHFPRFDEREMNESGNQIEAIANMHGSWTYMICVAWRLGMGNGLHAPAIVCVCCSQSHGTHDIIIQICAAASSATSTYRRRPGIVIPFPN